MLCFSIAISALKGEQGNISKMHRVKIIEIYHKLWYKVFHPYYFHPILQALPPPKEKTSWRSYNKQIFLKPQNVWYSLGLQISKPEIWIKCCLLHILDWSQIGSEFHRINIKLTSKTSFQFPTIGLLLFFLLLPLIFKVLLNSFTIYFDGILKPFLVW